MDFYMLLYDCPMRNTSLQPAEHYGALIAIAWKDPGSTPRFRDMLAVHAKLYSLAKELGLAEKTCCKLIMILNNVGGMEED
jgi:hypothetical protein